MGYPNLGKVGASGVDIPSEKRSYIYKGATNISNADTRSVNVLEACGVCSWEGFCQPHGEGHKRALHINKI